NAIGQTGGTAQRIGTNTRSRAQFAIVRHASISCAVVAFAFNRLLVGTAWSGRQFARKSKRYSRQRAIFSFRRFAKSARNSQEAPGGMGFCVRFQSCGAKFRSNHKPRIALALAVPRIGSNARPSATVSDFFRSERGVQTLPGRY